MHNLKITFNIDGLIISILVLNIFVFLNFDDIALKILVS